MSYFFLLSYSKLLEFPKPNIKMYGTRGLFYCGEIRWEIKKASQMTKPRDIKATFHQANQHFIQIPWTFLFFWRTTTITAKTKKRHHHHLVDIFKRKWIIFSAFKWMGPESMQFVWFRNVWKRKTKTSFSNSIIC